MHSFELRDDYIWMYNYIILVLFAYVRIRTKNTKKKFKFIQIQIYGLFFHLYSSKNIPSRKKGKPS